MFLLQAPKNKLYFVQSCFANVSDTTLMGNAEENMVTHLAVDSGVMNVACSLDF